MRRVYLHGALGDKYGESFNLEVGTAGEAIRALSCNFPTFLDDIREGSWHVVRGEDLDEGFSLGEDDIGFKLGRGDLHIAPYIAGSKQGGTLKIVLGVALIGVGLFMGLATPILGSAAGGALGGITYGNLAMVGAAMALAGVSSLLAPEEKSGDKDSSFTFSGPGNSYEQGSPVNLVYGGQIDGIIVGSVMISGGVDIEKIKVGV